MNSHNIIMIAGAGGNLGSAVAVELARGGARVACIDRSAEALKRLAEHLPANAESFPIVVNDLSDDAACAAAAAQVEERFGGIDALVNTVGGFQVGPIATEALRQWDLMMNLNGRTALAISAAVLPAMRTANYGRIVHIAAAPGLKAAAGQAAYAASKAAVIRLTEAIAAEYRADGITANCILPGTIDTPQNRAAMPNAKKDSWVSAQSIARLIAFLVSPAAAVVTGGAIPATGLDREVTA